MSALTIRYTRNATPSTSKTIELISASVPEATSKRVTMSPTIGNTASAVQNTPVIAVEEKNNPSLNIRNINIATASTRNAIAVTTKVQTLSKQISA